MYWKRITLSNEKCNQRMNQTVILSNYFNIWCHVLEMCITFRIRNQFDSEACNTVRKEYCSISPTRRFKLHLCLPHLKLTVCLRNCISPSHHGNHKMAPSQPFGEILQSCPCSMWQMCLRSQFAYLCSIFFHDQNLFLTEMLDKKGHKSSAELRYKTAAGYK